MEFSPVAYDKVGEIRGAIDQDAEAVFAQLSVEQAAIKRLFQRITERGEGDKPIRRPETFAVSRTLRAYRHPVWRRSFPLLKSEDCWFDAVLRMAKSKWTFRTSVLPGSGIV
jgi:hypothetical protein